MISHYKIPGGVTQKSTIKKGIEVEKFFAAVGIALAGLVIIVILGLLFSLPIMWLWNACLVPAVTGLHQVGWLQAWGIGILFSLLFKPTSVNSN